MIGFPAKYGTYLRLAGGQRVCRLVVAVLLFWLASMGCGGAAKAWRVNTLEESKSEIVMQPGTPEVKLDGRLVRLDAVPYVKNDRMMVPFRFVGESLGARVDWIGETNTVVFDAPGKRIELKIGSQWARVNDVAVELDVPPEIVEDRTFVPLRFVAEAMGADVQWDPRTSSAVITFYRKVLPASVGGGTRLTVRSIHAPGLDFLASVAMLMNNHDASIGLPKVALYGRAGRPVTGLSQQSIAFEAMQNLGYSAKLACVGLPNEPLLELLMTVPLSDGMVCKTSGEAFEKVKQLLDSGTPVGVAVDLSNLDLGEDLGGAEMVVVSGYDDDTVTLEVPSASKASRRVPTDAFIRAWSKEDVDSPGPNFFFWVRKSSKGVASGEMLRTARKDMEAAALALREYASQIRASGEVPGGAVLPLKRMGYWSRWLMADYLESINSPRAAARLRKAAEVYERLGPEVPIVELASLLEQASTFETEALRYWP